MDCFGQRNWCNTWRYVRKKSMQLRFAVVWEQNRCTRCTFLEKTSPGASISFPHIVTCTDFISQTSDASMLFPKQPLVPYFHFQYFRLVWRCQPTPWAHFFSQTSNSTYVFSTMMVMIIPTTLGSTYPKHELTYVERFHPFAS